MDYLPVHPLPRDDSQRLSQRLSLDFPYDWCNSGMSSQALIYAAIEMQRFEDLCKLAFYFGIESLRAESAARYGNDRSNWPGRLSDILDNIQCALEQHEDESIKPLG